jgi:hypothetical protein
MAVPKKKMSKSRKKTRRTYWKRKVVPNVIRAISLSRTLLREPEKIKNYLFNNNMIFDV